VSERSPTRKSLIRNFVNLHRCSYLGGAAARHEHVGDAAEAGAPVRAHTRELSHPTGTGAQ
jgi:hypothetical protein